MRWSHFSLLSPPTLCSSYAIECSRVSTQLFQRGIQLIYQLWSPHYYKLIHWSDLAVNKFYISQLLKSIWLMTKLERSVWNCSKLSKYLVATFIWQNETCPRVSMKRILLNNLLKSQRRRLMMRWFDNQYHHNTMMKFWAHMLQTYHRNLFSRRY